MDLEVGMIKIAYLFIHKCQFVKKITQPTQDFTSFCKTQQSTLQLTPAPKEPTKDRKPANKAVRQWLGRRLSSSQNGEQQTASSVSTGRRVVSKRVPMVSSAVISSLPSRVDLR